MTFAELSPPYSTIVADPPWHYDEVNPPNPNTGYIGAGLPYSTMTVDEIAAMPVGDLGDDARVFMWVTQRYLFDGPDILRAWGFEPATRVLVWCKPPMGTLNVTTEFVLMGKRGRPPRLPWHSTTWFQWPRRGGHSAKARRLHGPRRVVVPRPLRRSVLPPPAPRLGLVGLRLRGGRMTTYRAGDTPGPTDEDRARARSRIGAIRDQLQESAQ